MQNFKGNFLESILWHIGSFPPCDYDENSARLQNIASRTSSGRWEPFNSEEKSWKVCRTQLGFQYMGSFNDMGFLIRGSSLVFSSYCNAVFLCPSGSLYCIFWPSRTLHSIFWSKNWQKTWSKHGPKSLNKSPSGLLSDLSVKQLLIVLH